MSHISILSITLRQYRQMMLHLLIVTLIPTVYLPQAIHINKPFSFLDPLTVILTEVPLMRENSSGPVTFKILTPDPIFTNYI